MRLVKNGLLILLYATACATLTGLYTPILSPFYDLWIPQVSGYAISHGLQPHVDFFSPFGLLYHQLNGISYRLIEALPTYLQPFDINTLNSLIAALSMGGLVIIINRFLPVPSLVYLLVSATALQVRPISTIQILFDPTRFTWSGLYNNILWALILLQCGVVFSATSHRAKLIQNVRTIAVWNAIIVCITFHSKINFFMASGCIGLSYLCLLPRYLYLVFICYGSISLILMMFIYSGAFHYAYPTYINALWQAYTAKQALGDILSIRQPMEIVRAICLISIYIGGMMTLRNHRIWPYSATRTHLFDIAMIGAVFAICVGDTFYPSGLLPILTLVILYGALSSNTTCRWLLYSLVFLHLSALLFLTVEKHNITGITTPMTTSTLQSPYHRWVFKVPDDKGLLDLYSILPSSQPEHWVKQSYSYQPFRYRWRLPHGNSDYIHMINEATYYGSQTPPHSRLFFLGFANPLPLLLHREPPPYQPHWLDAFVTFHPLKMDFLSPILAHTDWLYMPILTTDQITNPAIQTHMNCAFYAWNHVHHRFVLNHISPYGLIFVKKQQASAPPLPLPPAFSIMDHCQHVAETLAQDYQLTPARSKTSHA